MQGYIAEAIQRAFRVTDQLVRYLKLGLLPPIGGPWHLYSRFACAGPHPVIDYIPHLGNPSAPVLSKLIVSKYNLSEATHVLSNNLHHLITTHILNVWVAYIYL